MTASAPVAALRIRKCPLMRVTKALPALGETQQWRQRVSPFARKGAHGGDATQAWGGTCF